MPEQVVEDVWRVDLGQVNAYIVATDEGPILVDAGLPGGVEMLRDAIREIGHRPEDLRAVLVTHTDLDHVGGLSELLEDSQARVHCSPTAAALLAGEGKVPWLNTKGLFQRLTGFFVSQPDPHRIDPVTEGDEVLGFQVVETPGHGLGHLAFARADGIVFVGDLVRLDKDEPRLSPSFVNYDTDQATKSLEHLLEAVDAIDVVCAGHGEPLVDEARKGLERLHASL